VIGRFGTWLAAIAAAETGRPVARTARLGRP